MPLSIHISLRFFDQGAFGVLCLQWILVFGLGPGPMECVLLPVFCSLENTCQRTSLARNLQKPKPVVTSVKQKPTGQFLEISETPEAHSSKSSPSGRMRDVALEQSLEEMVDLKEVEVARVLL